MAVISNSRAWVRRHSQSHWLLELREGNYWRYKVPPGQRPFLVVEDQTVKVYSTLLEELDSTGCSKRSAIKRVQHELSKVVPFRANPGSSTGEERSEEHTSELQSL